MNKDIYKNAMNQMKLSDNFHTETARKMKAARIEHKTAGMPVRKAAFAFAGAVVLIGGGIFAMNHSSLLSPGSGLSDTSHNSITIPEVSLPGGSQEVKARMRPLFVYQGRVYIQYNTTIATTDGSTVSDDSVNQLRGEYLGTTASGINEFSGKEDYSADFASNIGESDVYTVKGYDSKYRLMVYTEYDGGFSCEIYDSFGGLTMDSGADYFGILNLKDNIASYQWESFDSWNNGKLERVDEIPDESFEKFIDTLYEAVPVEKSIDLLIEDTSADSQKFLYLRTKDDLMITLRLLKGGYVYAPEIGFFQVDRAAFDAFYGSLQ